MEIEQLMDLGFTKNQAKTYIELIKNQGINAGKLAKLVSLDRSFVYSILESLIKRGLVYTSLKNNKKIFFASDPEILLKDINEQKSKALSLIKEINKVISVPKSNPIISFFEGKEGIKRYVREILNSNEVLGLGGGGKLNLLQILKYERHYFNEANKIRLTGKIICSSNNKRIWEKNLIGTRIKVRSFSGAGQENSITIFKDKVAISSEEEKPFVIFIKDESIASSFKYYFELLWKIAKK